jgi:hypothetical protein
MMEKEMEYCASSGRQDKLQTLGPRSLLLLFCLDVFFYGEFGTWRSGSGIQQACCWMG